MKALVTGGSGFLGSHLVERLEAAGHDVIVPRSADYDLTHEDDAARLFRETEPEVVFHLAAVAGGIGANRAEPGRFWHANLLMGTHVLEQSRIAGVRKLVLLGTICSYPKFTPAPFREEDLWNGYPEETNAPYGVAKKALLVGAQAYREQYGLNAITLLPVNLYGPRDNFDLETSHVVPALIRKMLESRDEVVLWGDGTPTREFLYAEDCAEGIALAAERYDGPDPVNLGSGEEISIRDLAALIADLTGFEGRITWDTSKPNGQPRRLLDTTKAAELFGFRAHTSLRARPRAHDRLVPRARIRDRYDGAARLARRRPRLERHSAPRAVAAARAAARRPLARAARLHGPREPQRLALLPGRRPDLVLDHELAHGPRLDHRAQRLARLVDAARPVHVDRWARIPRRPAVAAAAAGAGHRAHRALVRVRARARASAAA